MKASTRAMEDLCGVDPLVNIFRDLVSADTKSDPDSKTVPSTVGQLRLGAQISGIVNTMGFRCVQEPNGIVVAEVPASAGLEKLPRLALIAHLDTSPDAPGAGVKPMLVKDYDGGPIELENGLVTDASVCRELPSHKGDDIIVTSGETLLGADDKAGVAVIVSILREMSTDPSFLHPEVRAVFSVDEEIGKSAGLIDVEKLGCAYGVTVDGCEAGELDTATFNAEGAVVEITGRSVHTGSGYKSLVNACEIASRFMAMLPPDEKPENTMGTEGFFHVHELSGDAAQAKVKLIVRDFSEEGLSRRIRLLEDIVSLLNSSLGSERVVLKHYRQYSNMAKALSEHPQIVRMCREAYRRAGMEPRELSVRGGTDGSNLSNRGLPCPNIFTGALCCHGVHECLPVRSLHLAHDAVKALAGVAAEGGEA
jgi:tripeptide aminopeptidase